MYFTNVQIFNTTYIVFWAQRKWQIDIFFVGEHHIEVEMLFMLSPKYNVFRFENMHTSGLKHSNSTLATTDLP
jgi:hypothetical protein